MRLICVFWIWFVAGVVPEYQCAVKREAKKAQKEKDRPNATSLGSPEMKDAEVKVIHQMNVSRVGFLRRCFRWLPSVDVEPTQVMTDDSFWIRLLLLLLIGSFVSFEFRQQQLIEEKPASILTSNGVKPLSPEQNELINRLVHFQEEFDQPSEEDLRNISVRFQNASQPTSKQKFQAASLHQPTTGCLYWFIDWLIVICCVCFRRQEFTNRTARPSSSTSPRWRFWRFSWRWNSPNGCPVSIPSSARIKSLSLK